MPILQHPLMKIQSAKDHFEEKNLKSFIISKGLTKLKPLIYRDFSFLT